MAANPSVNGHELANLAPGGANTPVPSTAATSTQNLLAVPGNAFVPNTSGASTSTTTAAASPSNASTSATTHSSSLPGQSATVAPPNSTPTTPRPTLLATARRASRLCLTFISRPFTYYSSLWTTYSKPLKYFWKPIISLLIYILTVYTAWESPSRRSPIGRISPEWGIWVLAIFGKAGDISFAFSFEDAFDTFAWRKLRNRTRVGAPMSLVWWTSLLSSTGFGALVKIVWRGLKRSVKMCWRRRKDGQGLTRGEWWREWTDARWGLGRLICLMLLIPGPGISLLSNISPKTVCVPTSSLDVTGGLAAFDPGIAEAFRRVSGPLVAKLVQSSLRDRTITWPVDAHSAACKAGKACEAYLIAGPAHTVRPWPFRNDTENESGEGFLLHQAPVAMVEMWDFKDDEGTVEDEKFDRVKECVLYGGFDPKNEYSFWVCIGERGSEGELVAAWFACQLGYSTSGTCLRPSALPGLHGWKQHMRFYNLTTDMTFSRADFTILSATNPSLPSPLPLPAASLFRALNTALYRPNQPANDFRYDRNTLPYTVTQSIGANLWASLYERARGSTSGRDSLRNALTMPLFAFQRTVLAVNTSVVPENGGEGLQAGLPAANTLKGSYCRVASRSVPGRGSVITYACVAGVVVVLLFTLKGWALRYRDVRTIGVLMVDFDELVEVVVGKDDWRVSGGTVNGAALNGGTVGGERYVVVRVGDALRTRDGGRNGDVWEGMQEMGVRMVDGRT